MTVPSLFSALPANPFTLRLSFLCKPGWSLRLRLSLPLLVLVLVLALARAGVSAPVTGKVVDDHIVTSRRIQFITGKVALTAASDAVLERVAALILSDTPADTVVVVEGHSDRSGDLARDAALADARAVEVVRRLVALGVSPDRLSARGRGTSTPLVSPSSNEQWRNRRVEFVLQPRLVPLPEPPEPPKPPVPVLAVLDDDDDDAAAAAEAPAANLAAVLAPLVPLLDDEPAADELFAPRFALVAIARPNVALLDEPDLIAPSFRSRAAPNIGVIDDEARP